MIERPLFLINSHVGYDVALQQLLDSISNIPPQDIMIVIGGDTREYVLLLPDDKRVFHVTHDSFDYTGLIKLLNTSIINQYTHVFCLQDTMLCGENTYNLICSASSNSLAIAAFGGQCNLVLYRTDYLKSQRDFILSCRNCTKLESIHYEGALWKMTSDKISFPNSTISEDRQLYYPYNETPRIKEYYHAVDITKYKANYGQNMNNLIETF